MLSWAFFGIVLGFINLALFHVAGIDLVGLPKQSDT
jgi:hypothetical protein